MSSMESTYRHIIKFNYEKWLLPLALVGMTGSAVSFLRSFCTGNTRWLMLGILFLYFILKRNLLRYFDVPFLLMLFVYLGWSFLSSFWSVAPILSFMKSSIFIVLSLTLMRSGIEWVRINSWRNSLNYLWLFVIIAMLSGFLGRYSADAYGEFSKSISLFQGLVRGANMFGALMAMSLPFLLWTMYKAWPNKKYFFLYFFLSANCLNFIILSFSRSAMLTAIFILMGFIASLNLNKKITILALSLLIGCGAIAIKPSLVNNIVEVTQKYAFKGYNQSVLYSREESWNNSYELAAEGGWFGLGYGATLGQEDFDPQYGLVSFIYGREKGNSQLAIVEETGVVGLILYAFLMLFMLGKLFLLYINSRDNHQRVLIGIISGTVVGMIVQSGFEAWWDSPGSPESIYFWLMIGIVRGLEIVINNQRVTYGASRIKA